MLVLTQLGSRQEKPTAGSSAPASAPGKAVTEAPAAAPALKSLEPDEWLASDDFKAELSQEASAGYYPDMTSGRCQDGVVQYHAHWTQRPPTFKHWFYFGLLEDKFNAKKADLTSQGFAVQYQNTFKDCDGRARYQSLWTKGG